MWIHIPDLNTVYIFNFVFQDFGTYCRILGNFYLGIQVSHNVDPRGSGSISLVRNCKCFAQYMITIKNSLLTIL